MARWHDQISRWLDDTTRRNAEQHADILLATDEAVSNCVEHAYLHHDHPGIITVHLRHDVVAGTVEVRVTDHGRWAPLAPAPTSKRGRGMALMRALAQHCTIEGTDRGTVVTMVFTTD